MGLFSRQETMQPIPVVDVAMQQAMNQPPPPTQSDASMYLDPMQAAQMTRGFDSDPSSVGIAQITVDNKRMIDEFRARLRGYRVVHRVNPETGEEAPPESVKFGEPVLNEDGINHLCGILESALSKNIMLSNIPIKDEKWIKKVCAVFMRTIALQIGINSEKWRVDRTRRDFIPMEMTLLLHANYMRAYDDGERRKLYPGQKHVTTTMINPALSQPERRPILGF